MAETTPLLDRQFLQSTFAKDVPIEPVTLPNVPFRPPSTPLPSIDGQPTPSALSAIENSVLSAPSNGMLIGGGIPRGLNEVQSDKYNVFVPGDYNNEDAYAQGQGWPSKMVNGVGKGLLLTAGTLLQTTIGTANGIARLINTGRAASFYDNELNRWVDDVNKAAEDILPNYYTDIEKNARWYSPSKLVTANFFWDGIVKNLGFAAGAAISGGLFTQGLRALPLTARLFSVGKAAETLAATEEALLTTGKTAETYGKVKSLSDKFLGSYRLLNPAGRSLVAALATTGEAGFEAFHNLNEFRDRKIQEWKDTHGGMDPKGADLDAINSEADGVGNSSFLLNTALLSATNYIQFPKILGSSYTIEKGMINSLKKDISNITKNAAGEFVIPAAKTVRGNITSAAKRILPYTFSASEAFEEGAQYAISVGTKDYYNKKYDGDIADFLESTIEGISQTFGTDEGMENILIGGLSGAIMLGRGKYKAAAERSRNTANAVQSFNKWQLSDFTKDTIDSVNRGTILQEERERLLRQGDVLGSKDKETDYIINYLTPRIKYGRFDLVQTDIAEFKQLAATEEGFAQLQAEGKALPGDTKEAYLQRLASLETTAENVHSLYQSLTLRYGDNPAYTQEVMDQMIYAATKVADYDTRIPALTLDLSTQGIMVSPTFISNVVEGGTSEFNRAIAEINKLDILSDQKESLRQDLTDLKELVRRRQIFLKEYDEIKKNPNRFTTAYLEEQKVAEATQPTILPDREYQTEDIDKAVVHKVTDNDWQVKSGNDIIATFPTKEEAEAERDIFNIAQQSSRKIRVIETNPDGSVKVEDSEGNIVTLSKGEIDKYELIETEAEITARKEREQLEKQEEIRRDLLASGDKGVQTTISDKEYEPSFKKSNIAVVTSTKPATSSTLPHHIRANVFGANLDNFPNRDKIKAILVNSKNEDFVIPGLTNFLKGTSDVDASKIVAMVMVEQTPKGWELVGVDGKILTNGSVDNAIFQVMPDPKLEWSKEYGGGSMFRKETTPEQIEYYKKQYSEWINEVLQNESDNFKSYNINASFGIPQYVTYTDDKGNEKRDYNAIISVEDAGLIESSDLVEKPLVFIPTVENTIEKGSVSFNTPLGRPFLNLSNGYVKLNNRQLTKQEASTIYEAIHQLAIDVFKNGNAKSDRAKRLQNWLKSIIYWGTPKNATGYNSVFYDVTPEGEFLLHVSGKGNQYPFTPSSIEANKVEITTLIEGMYNNINSGLTDKPELWNESYEEITNIDASGKIESKQWTNYQTYLLSTKDRKLDTLPLSVQLKPIEEGETNRTGIYFTIKDTVDRFAAPPVKKEVKPAPSLKEAPVGTYVLDNKTVNTYVSPAGKQIKFIAGNTLDSVKVLQGGDLTEVLNTLKAQIDEEKAKENIKNAIKVAITPQLKASPADQSYIVPDDEGEEEQPEGAKKIFGKTQQPAKIEVSKEEETLMELQMDDLEEDIPLRAKISEQISNFEGEDWTKTEQWLKANFPLLPVYRVKNIIQAVNGAQAWGMLKNGAIYVYENAEVGTIYHEVFEGIWKIFASESEQTSIIKEFKARKGSFIDRPTGKTINYSEATDQQVKEQLAEEFRDYILYKKVPAKPVDGRPFIVKLFSDLVNFIRSFFTGPQAETNTEKLFEKIGTGYYKQYTPTSVFSFAKQGIIDIEEAFADNYSEFRIKNIPADVANDIIQQMTYITLTDLIRDNKSLFNFPKINRTSLYEKLKTDLQKTALKSRKAAQELVRQNKFTQAQADPIIEKSKTLWKSITAEWEEIKKKHEEYLKVYSIEFDENDDVILKDEDASKRGDYQDATKIDTFKKANSAIKLLLSTIPRVNSNGKLVHSSINGASLLPTSEVFMAIMNNVHNSRNIDEMMDRLREMSEEDINYKTLYNRLTKNTSDLSQISEVHDAQLLAAFWRTFKKQNPDVKNVYIFENGDVEVGDSNLSNAARQISADYANAIIKVVKGTNPYFEYSAKDRVYIGKPSGVKGVKLDNDKNRINFLKSLGIEFKLDELNKLPGDKLSIFREAVAGIKTSIEKADKIATVSRKILDIKGRLMQLSLIRASIDNPEFDSTFFNVKGERTQSFIGTNPVSDLHDYLSQIENKNELLGTPFEYLLIDSFSQGSIILNKMFNPETGNRIKGGEQLMKPGYADGTINTENGKKKQSAKLTYKERLVQEINLNSAGYYYNLVPGDSSMEWMVYMGNPVSSKSLLSGYSNVFDIFREYFISEVNLSREDRIVVGNRNNKDLRFFKAILGEELHNKIIKEKGSPDSIYIKYKSQIDNAVQKFIEKQGSDFKDTLSQYEIIKPDTEGFVVENLSFSQGETMTEEVLNRNLNTLSANFIINNIELHKLLYSDPYQYSDELKRIKNANSPRQAIISNSPAMNAALNNIWNEGYDKEDIGYTEMTRDYFRTITLSDVVSTSELKDYGTFEETDGGGIISMKAYRWFRIKAGEWNEDEERQYRYDIAYEKIYKDIRVSDKEAEIYRKGNPEIKSAYTPLKPIVFGNKANGQEYNSVVLDKFALYPLSYRIAHSINPESNAIKHYNKMQRENIDYTVFASGRKVGNEGSNLLYNSDGSFNQLPYRALVNISHSIISIQSEVPSKDESVVTRGSQITKLATLDYMEAGVPIDFGKGEFKQRFADWNDLSENQKEEQSPLYKEIKNNQKLLEAITEEGYRSLLVRMGIQEDEDGNFIITDFTKIAETLKDEILKREVNDNIIDAFEGFKNGDVVLEATPAYQQIRNILYSLADKNIISPKISGGQKVQIPSTLLESVRAKETTINGKKAFVSDNLRFYEDEDGKRTCEIMVGRWFDSPLSDDELLTYLNKTKGGQEILAGIAYRIPTQKQNSIDSFVIKQFLPREFGDSVIIPSALVKKVGSDFDIDKLFIYFKNIYKDETGNIKILPFYGYGQKAIDKFKELFLNIKDLKIADTEGKLEKQTKLSNLFGDIALGLKEGKIAEKWTPIFQEWFKDELIDGKFPVQRIEEIFITRIERLNKTLDTLTNDDIQEILSGEMAERWYKQSLENEYIQSLQNLVSHPLNFENLIKPNSADQLKGLAREITKLTGVGEFDYKSTGNLINRNFMSRLRHAFVSGKYAIGIAAVNQTNHSLNQRQPIYIDQTKWDVIPQDDKSWLTGGTLNPEDITIKFKNYNKIEIGDKIVPTLSMIKNSDGENISDIIGQFIDGYVDISKGPWIMELGATPNVAGVWLFLIKIGVPINDVAYFMNQPIIRDYLRTIENAGYSWLFIDDFVADMMDVYSPQAQMEVENEIPSTSALEKMVGKKTKDLSNKQKNQQQFILSEFLKYAKMANHMFLVTQGSNLDTATFNDPYLVFKKQEQLKKAQSTIISSVNSLINNSFIGKLSDKINDIRDAFSTVLVSDKSNVREVIEDVLRPYVDMSDRDFVKLAQKAVNDLFDWAVQIDRNLNSQVTKILLSDENTAKQMSDFVVSVRKDEKHPLYNNQVIKLVTPHFDSRENHINNLKIKNKDNKVYDQNQMIYAFSELKRYLNGQNSSLYGALVRLAILQSGLSNSPISFTSLLPYEDFKEIYNKTLSTLENMPNLEDFRTMDIFQRNNWTNDDIVPLRRARWKQNKNGEWKYNNNFKFFGNKRVERAIRQNEIPQLLKINTKSREADNDIIVYSWETGSKKEKAEMRKKGDFSYIHKGLFKKIYQGDQPLVSSYLIGDVVISDYIYKPINAWGDSHSTDGVYFAANEFYSTPKQSVIDNGFMKVEKELADETIITYFEDKKETNIIQESTSMKNSQLPLSEPMNYKMPRSQNIIGIDTTTFDLIKEGKRTSTTRGYWYNVIKGKIPINEMVGKVVSFESPKHEKVNVIIESVHKITNEDRKNAEFLKQWENSEKWTKEHLLKETKVGEYQVKFKLLPLQENAIESLEKSGQVKKVCK